MTRNKTTEAAMTICQNCNRKNEPGRDKCKNCGATLLNKARFALNDKANLKRLREAIEENLAEVAQELGIQFKTGSIKFEADGTGCMVQLKVEAPDRDGTIRPQHEKDFERYNSFFASEGLKPEHLHQTIKVRGEEHEIVGLKPNSRKFPIVVKSKATGKLILVGTVFLLQFNQKES